MTNTFGYILETTDDIESARCIFGALEIDGRTAQAHKATAAWIVSLQSETNGWDAKVYYSDSDSFNPIELIDEYGNMSESAKKTHLYVAKTQETTTKNFAYYMQIIPKNLLEKTFKAKKKEHSIGTTLKIGKDSFATPKDIPCKVLKEFLEDVGDTQRRDAVLNHMKMLLSSAP